MSMTKLSFSRARGCLVALLLGALSSGTAHAQAEETEPGASPSEATETAPTPPVEEESAPEAEPEPQTPQQPEAPEADAEPPQPEQPETSEPAPAEPPPSEIAEPVEVPVVEGAGEAGELEPGAMEAVEGEAEVPAVEEVTIAGTSVARTAGSAHVIRPAQLQRFAYDDPSAVLQQVPGAYVRHEDGVGLRPNIGIRGVNPDRTKKLTLMEDGILFGPAPYSAPAAYYFPLMARMSSVRVIKGPAGVAYGPQTVGGAVDLMTRAIPSQPKGMLDFGLGEYGYAKAHGHFGASGDNFGFLVEGIHLHNDGFKKLPDGANTGSTRNEWMIKSSYVLDPNARAWNEFSLKLVFSDEVSNETYLGLTDADFRKDPFRRYAASALDQLKGQRKAVVLSHLFELPESSIHVRTSVYRHELERSWNKLNRFRGGSIFDVLRNPDDPGNAAYYGILTGQADSSSAADTLLIGPNARSYVSQGVQSVLNARPKTGPIAHKIEAGLRFHYDSIERRHSESGYLMVGGELESDGQAETVTAASFASTYALAGHVMDAMSWKRLTVTPGVRVELIRSQVDDWLTGDSKSGSLYAIMPGVGAFYALTNDFGVLAGVHRGFSPPPPASDDHIEPEYSINYEAGARFSKKALRAEVIGFFNDYSNLTDICTLSSGCLTDDLDRQFDAGRAHIYGVEAYATHELPAGPVKIPVTVAYTFTRARFQNTFQSQDPIYGAVTEGDEIPYVPRHQASASLGIEGKIGGAVAGVTYVSPMREQAGSEPLEDSMHTDEQFLLDVGGRLRVYGPVSVYANARNVLNSHYIVSRRPYGARPNAPRWVQAGARVDF